ncbi:Hsp70 family protein [Mesobaculum littorinae]|uniref:Hsp70 family protein n=1 Tax=Mesobaculum littorinae TaxID=2486419 RepID=A0A438AGA8_9RHOB|nr:Hsp70 family protein [Mesobaculum littorinae]RVV97597.1 Hsp70 family protein [Mesobaculum littorinae]
MARTLGIDFGTSNSAAGFAVDGVPRLIGFDGDTTTPTALFLDYEARRTLLGRPANDALLRGDEGRYMRALKRVLGTSLMHEKRQLLNDRVTFVDLIARFLRMIKEQAERETGLVFDRALSGRPVFFHRPGDPREGQAEEDLRACYLAAGFAQVDFLAEPEAAAIATNALDRPGELGVVVDIGGGTSDFSVFRSGEVAILANHGVRIGGTDFDRSISFDHVMPLMGKGSSLRKVMGDGLSPVPLAIYNDLATWEKIPFLYTPQTRRQVAEMEKLATEPEKFARLATILEDELGHDLAFAVEAGKIDVNRDGQVGRIALGEIEPGLAQPLSAGQVAESLAAYARDLSEGLQVTLDLAGVAPEAIDRVIYVGGSSLMTMVSDTMTAALPRARHEFSEVFTAVAHGLAIASGRS